MREILRIIIIASVMVAGCHSIQELPREYWGRVNSEVNGLEKVYVSTSTKGIAVKTKLVSINGFRIVSDGPINVPVGTHKFVIECEGKEVTVTEERTYSVQKNKKHVLMGLDNGVGSCFFTITYI